MRIILAVAIILGAWAGVWGQETQPATAPAELTPLERLSHARAVLDTAREAVLKSLQQTDPYKAAAAKVADATAAVQRARQNENDTERTAAAKSLLEARTDLARLEKQAIAMDKAVAAAQDEVDAATHALAAPKVVTTRKAGHRVIYVLDASASMAAGFAAIREQLKQAVENLEAEDSFNVYLAQGSSYAPAFPKGLVAADNQAKEAAETWLDRAAARGDDSTHVALAAAARARPEVVWLISDGDWPNPAAVSAACQVLAIAKVKIHTTTAGCQPEAVRQQQMLWRIARDSGGMCVDARGRRLAGMPADRPPAPPN